MMDWLYEHVRRVPPITDSQIQEMRHIEPVLKADGVMYQRILDIDKIHPRDVSFLWDAKPVGELFTFDTLNITTIITQHKSAVFFKPSLAEVYAWLRVYMPTEWKRVRFFCMGDAEPIGSSTDIACKCQIMGGDMLVSGREIRFANGSIGHELVKMGQH